MAAGRSTVLISVAVKFAPEVAGLAQDLAVFAQQGVAAADGSTQWTLLGPRRRGVAGCVCASM